MADIRNCEQCGTSFAPRREHARFCSARCRVAWNRHNASDSPADTGPLDWSITAMRETTDRLMRSGGLDQVNGFAVISEAVWWVTMVDATLMRYQPDVYNGVLAGQHAAERRIVEDTFGTVANQLDARHLLGSRGVDGVERGVVALRAHDLSEHHAGQRDVRRIRSEEH